MSFDSIFFISVFIPIVSALYFLIPSIQAKNILLLVASIVFYSFGSFSGLLILIALVLINYLLTILLKKNKPSKAILILGIVINLSVLFFFKYLNFFVSDILGLQAVNLGIAAPLGISFLVFKSISLIVDTYKQPQKTDIGFFNILIYISFFPQVTAGPIARYGQFASQLESRSYNLETVTLGIRRFVIGLSKKVIICSSLAKIVDTAFNMSGELDFRLAWLAAISYSLQIYFDFSGYSDMAIGLGNIFGFKTLENFDYPYLADSIGNFWRRWHISLSSWFRDYLYIPLGGNRKGTLRTALNKLIVFTLCGFWHGANWTFMLWGFWHGLWIGVESLFKGTIKKLNSNKLSNILMRVYTLLAVVIGFVMFRASSVAEGFSLISAMFTGFQLNVASTVALSTLLNAKSVLILVLAVILSLPIKKLIKKEGNALTTVSLLGSVLLFALCVLGLSAGGFAPFIYAQF